MDEQPTEGDNLAAVLHGKRDLRMESMPIPAVGDNDVLLRMSSVGICGSDIKYWTHGYCGIFVVKDPMVLAIRFCATPPVHGNIARFYSHPADFCFRLPENVSDDEGALMEPLAVAIHACRRGRVKAADNVLICGAGPVGILCLWVARLHGASSVMVTDIDDNRLDFAVHQGATHVINVSGQTEPNVAKLVENRIGSQPDSTIECSGSDFSMTLGVHATRPGGTIVQVGRGSATPTIPLNLAASKEVDIRGVFRYANCYPTALELITKGRLPNLKHLVTHHFPLADTEKAFIVATSRDHGALKVMIHCDQ